MEIEIGEKLRDERKFASPAELRAQIQLARKMGLDIKFCDEHMVFGWVAEGLVDGMKKMCADESLLFLNWHDLTIGRLKLTPIDDKRDTGKERAARPTDPVQATIADMDYCMQDPSVVYLYGGHPGYAEGDFLKYHMPGQKPGDEAIKRDQERRTFMYEQITAYCRQRNVELLKAADLPAE